MRNFYEMIREQEADRLALVEEGKEYTYGELVKLSQEKGDRLRQEKSEKKVIFLREKRILDQLVSFLGCQAAGKIPLLVPEDAKQLPEIGEVPENACMAEAKRQKNYAVVFQMPVSFFIMEPVNSIISRISGRIR